MASGPAVAHRRITPLSSDGGKPYLEPGSVFAPNGGSFAGQSARTQRSAPLIAADTAEARDAAKASLRRFYPEEGMTMEETSELLEVSRQRVSALLRNSSAGA